MIEPINSINLQNRDIKFSKKIVKNSNNAQNPYEINSIYDKNTNISFTHYLNPLKEANFDKTIEDNYFQLPVITLANGQEYQLMPDKSQLECAEKLYKGDSVVYCAPTGTGKTAVAHYIMTKNLLEGKKTIYTTPLKALANDKLREFRKIYGDENVGLLTGDIKINTNAPIQIMTAEIYNNQVPHLKKDAIETVIFDEVHYIGSFDRGNVWENSIINSSKKDVQILALSATVGNSRDVASWIQKINYIRGVEKVEISPDERFVPLKWHIHKLNNQNPDSSDKTGKFIDIENYKVNLSKLNPYNLSDKQKRALEIIYKAQNNIEGSVVIDDDEYRLLAQKMLEDFSSVSNLSLDEKDFKKLISKIYPEIKEEKAEEMTQLLLDRSTREIFEPDCSYHRDDFASLVKDLKREDMLPALIFKLSRNQTKNVIASLKEGGVDLTTKKEKEEIRKILDEYEQKGIYLGDDFDKEAILSGYANHHAGKLPQYRKLIEELFSRKLLKVVSATSTLSAGINMPARTVVISDVIYQKYNPLTDEIEYTPLNASDFHQMAGRAGRRGIDNIGHVVLYNLSNTPKELKVLTKIDDKREIEEKINISAKKLAFELLESGSNNIKSAFSPEWTSLAQYYSENDSDEGLEDLIDDSLKIFLSNRKEKDKNNLLGNFMKYKNVLEKLEYIKTDRKTGKIQITPKGEILIKSQSSNPLLLAGLIYDEQLKNVDVFDLCQIMGYIASYETGEIDENINKIIADKLNFLIPYRDKTVQYYKRFKEIKEKTQKYEAGVLRRENESRISKDRIIKSDVFGGYITYIWALLNESGRDSIQNFKLLTELQKTNQNKKNKNKKTNEALDDYNRKAIEGNVYKIISQSVSLLNRTDAICDFALENPDKYPNTAYYSDLKTKVAQALDLIKQNPIYDETSL